MRRTRWIRNKILGVLALALGLVLALTSCSLFAPPPEATGAPPTASPTATAAPSATDPAVQVEFPGREDLQAAVEPVEQTPEMDAAMPSDEPVNDLVDITLTSGSFPDTGATVTFEIDQTLPEGAAPAVVHWNEELAQWEPLASELSADGTELSADVEHFSKYGWVDGVYNWLNDAVGNYGNQPSCPGTEPEWSEVAFHDDMNGPLLWCVGTDQKNSDILEVRVVANRSSAMLISTAITPEWAWSDALGDTGLETWVATSLDVPAALGPSYLLPPGGEYRFGFHKDKLFEFWRSDSNDVLIQADTTGASVMAGVAYNAAMNHYGNGDTKVGRTVAVVAAVASLAECSYTIKDLSESTTSASIMDAYASCLDGQRDAIEHLIKSQVGDAGKGAVKWMKYAAAYYALVKGTLALGSLIGDATLPAIAFQLHFTPSLEAIPEAVGRSGQKADLASLCGAGCTPGGEATIDHPAWGQVRIVTFTNEDLSQPAVIAAVDEADKVLWSAETSGLMQLAPASTPQDATGNVFLNSNAGRYNTVIVLKPTAEGFDGLGSIPTGDDRGRFYFSSIGEGQGGQFVLWDFDQDCTPSCAEGTITKERLEWDGSDYVPTGPAQVTEWPDEDYVSPS